MRGDGQLRAAVAIIAALIASHARGEPPTVDRLASAAPIGPVAGAMATVLPPPGEAPVQLVVNGVAGAVVIVQLESGGDVWIPVSALEGAGLHGVRGARRTLDRVESVSLLSLAPALSFVLDDDALELRVEARAELLGRVTLDGGAASRPEGLLIGGSSSAFVNYAVQANDARQVSAFVEIGAGAGRWLATTGVSRDSAGRVLRGLSTVTLEDPGRLRRWIAGDAVGGGAPLGGSAVLAGFGVERDFGLDPWFVRQPLPRTSAVALTPSTLDVYVNNRLVRRDLVAPGTIDLSNLPVEAGAGQVRTVLRDAYGRSQDVTTGYYFSSGLLAPGVSDYAVHGGLRRDGLGASSASYADAVALGRWRAGWTERLTVGGRLDAGRRVVSGGPQLTVATPAGEVELAAGASGDGSSGGAAGFAGWGFSARRIGAGARLQAMSRSYVHASLAASQDRALLQTGAFVTVPLTRGTSVGAETSWSRMRAGQDVGTALLRGNVALGGGASLLLSAGWARETSGGAGPTAMVLFTHALGNQTVASAGAERDVTSRSRRSVDLQRTLPVGAGYGYRIQASDGDASVAAATLEAQGDHGRVEASYQRANGISSASGAAAGGVVYMDGDLFLTRAVQDGFALVQVPGVEGVRAYLNSTEVGRTNAHGNALVPGLVPYNANRVSIRAADVPIEYELDAVERVVAPPRRIGARVRFDARCLQAVTGTVSVEEQGGSVIPVYGELRVDGARDASPIGSDGRYYLSTVGPGRHDAEVVYAGGTCRFAIEVPSARGSVTDVGAARCVRPTTAGAGGAPSVSTVIQSTSGSALVAGNDTRTGIDAP